MALKENYKDDILDVSVNTKRKYRMTENGDGTVSFEDETEYLQEGDNFGSGAINPIAHAINGLNNYNFHPSGSIDLVAYIADDSYYLNEDNKYVLADSPTGQALITSEPNTYKALASNTDLYGIEGEDTVSGFEPSSTPITVGGETLSTIDDKLNFLCNGGGNSKITVLSNYQLKLYAMLLENNQMPTIEISMDIQHSASYTITAHGTYIDVICTGQGTGASGWARIDIYAKLSGKYAIKGFSTNEDRVVTVNANELIISVSDMAGHNLPALVSNETVATIQYLGNN